MLPEVIGLIEDPHTEKPVCKDGYYVKEKEFNEEPIYCFECINFCETCTETECLTCKKVEEAVVREVVDGACVCVNTLETVGD